MISSAVWNTGSFQTGVTVELSNIDGFMLQDLKERVEKTVEANKKVVEYNKTPFDKRPKEKPEAKPLQDEDVEKILNFLKRMTQDFQFASSNIFEDPFFDTLEPAHVEPVEDEVLL